MIDLKKSLTPERRGEIAILFLKHKLRQTGIKFSKETRREITNVAKSVGVSDEEALAFVQELALELFNETFSQKKGK
ncbi:MAG: hypothetical protein ACI9GH_000537 [Candidatus Paceibacteria bacterium]|jgi:hypothetical protein